MPETTNERPLPADGGWSDSARAWLDLIDRGEAGNRLHQKIYRYAEERPVVLEWSGVRIVNWHRPLDAYMTAYLNASLILRAFVEPVPRDDSHRADPPFEDWYRVPLFTVMQWEKPA